MQEICSHFIPTKGAEREVLGSPNRCIYTGKSANECKLTDEHIIPDGLGGTLIAQKASSIEAAQKINPSETRIIRGIFGAAREALGISSRKKGRKRKKSTQNIYVEYGADAGWFESFVEKHKRLPSRKKGHVAPECVFVPKYGGSPGIIAPNTPETCVLSASFRDKFKGPIQLAANLDFDDWERFAAKVAHSYASAVLGPNNYIPFLASRPIQQVRRGFNRNHEYFGSFDGQVDDAVLHKIGIARTLGHVRQAPMVQPIVRPVLVVQFQIFSNISSVVHQVVVGNASRAAQA